MFGGESDVGVRLRPWVGRLLLYAGSTQYTPLNVPPAIPPVARYSIYSITSQVSNDPAQNPLTQLNLGFWSLSKGVSAWQSECIPTSLSKPRVSR